MQADRDKWNDKYRDRSGERPEPDEFVVRHVDKLVGQTVLDVACGDGGNALFLAEKGFDVTGLDISEVGLERLRGHAARLGVEVETLRRDLDESDALADCGPFDHVVIARFKPPDAFWHSVGALLRPDGILLLCTFTTRQHEEHGFPRRFCLEPGELVGISDALDCVHRETFGGPDRYSEGYVFRRK